MAAIPDVPWTVGGGAKHDASTGRLIPYFMFGGQEGVLNSTDCSVRPLATPGTSVRISPGAFIIRNRALGGTYEAYLNKIDTEILQPITATGAGTTRSDLVILRVEDPHEPGEPWPDPTDVQIGPYQYIRVIENVPSTTTSIRQLGNNFSAITLARIDIPANTGTITTSMIKDLRSLVNPVTGPTPPPQIIYIENDDVPEVTDKLFFDAKSGTTTQSVLTNVASGTWYDWPSQAQWLVPIPTWATGVDVSLILSGVDLDGDVYGYSRINIDNTALSVPGIYNFNYNSNPGTARETLMTAGTVSIPSGLRGKIKMFKHQARVDTGTPTHTGRLRFREGSTMTMQMVFKQQPILG